VTFHPRQNWNPARRRREYTRREFIRYTTAAGIALPSLASLLAACGGGEQAGGSPEVLIGTLQNPVIQPLFDDNAAIASGLTPEPGPLRLYNWEDYIGPDLLTRAEEDLGVKIELSTYYNEEESIQKLASGEVSFDVWWPTSEVVGKSVAGRLIQPLNHDYPPNLSNVWPQLANPYYDQGSAYTVPYVIYQTGIAWRTDMVDSADVEGIDNPYDVFWNSKYKGIAGLYDDFEETLQLAMFRAGITDPREATADDLNAAADSLIELVDLMNIHYTIDGTYVGIPEGRFGVHHAWSGDVINLQYYFPEGGDPSVARYLWPAKAQSPKTALIANDTLAVPKGAEHLVNAHRFLNFMLDATNSVDNFGWVGYQPPQVGLEIDRLVADGYVPDYLASAIVSPEDFEHPNAYVSTQLTPEQEVAWLDAWNRVQGTA
jgi:spermidine/putrescine transport system substrate-binding protein